MRKPLYVVSDLHLGAGTPPLEDFLVDKEFGDFLCFITEGFASPVELIVLGDAFDFPQAIPEIGAQRTAPNIGSSEAESIQQIEAIITGHPVFFDSLQQFLDSGNMLRFVRGNHDVDLIWPGVQKRITAMLGGASDKLIFEDSHVFRTSGVHLEHGNQHDTENGFHCPDCPFLTGLDLSKRLARCWGTYLVETVVNDIDERYPIVDNLVIDNVISVSRALYLALRDAPIFSGKQIARILLVSAQVGAPWGTLRNATIGIADDAFQQTELDIASGEDFLLGLDVEIGDAVLKRMENEAVRKEFDAEMEILLSSKADVFFAPAGAAQNGRMLGWFTKDSYARAAERILVEDNDVQLVVFGHTHSELDHKKIDVPWGKRYINSGTWIPRLNLRDPRNAGKSFSELCQNGYVSQNLSYVKIVFDGDGTPSAELFRFEPKARPTDGA